MVLLIYKNKTYLEFNETKLPTKLFDQIPILSKADWDKTTGKGKADWEAPFKNFFEDLKTSQTFVILKPVPEGHKIYWLDYRVVSKYDLFNLLGKHYLGTLNTVWQAGGADNFVRVQAIPTYEEIEDKEEEETEIKENTTTEMTAMEPDTIAKFAKLVPRMKEERTTTCYNHFKQLELFFSTYQISEDVDKLVFVGISSQENPVALEIFNGKLSSDKYSDVKEKLMKFLDGSSKLGSEELFTLADELTFEKAGSLTKYWNDFSVLKAKPCETVLDETYWINKFRKNLPEEYGDKLLLLNPKTMQEAYEKLLPLRTKMEASLCSINRYQDRSGTKREVICQLCNKKGHIARNCFSLSSKNTRTQMPRQIRCYSCGQSGHIAKNCRNQRSGNQMRRPNTGRSWRANLNNVDDQKLDVEERMTELEERIEKMTTNDLDMVRGSKKVKNEIFQGKDIICNFSPTRAALKLLTSIVFLGRPFAGKESFSPKKCIIDSGANASILSYKWAKEIGLKIKTDRKIRVSNFENFESKNVMGYATCSIYIPETNKSILFHPIIMANTDEFLLGLDVLQKLGGFSLEYNGNQASFAFGSRSQPAVRVNHLRADKRVFIKPFSSFEVKVAKSNVKGPVIIDQLEKQKFGVIEGFAETVPEYLTLFNPTSTKISIEKGQPLARADEAEEFATVNTARAEMTDDQKRDIESKIDKKLADLPDNSLKKELRKLLMEFWDVFDFVNDVGKFPQKVTINPLNEQIKVKPQKRRAFNPNVWKLIEPELQKLIDQHIIRKSTWPYSSPANLVCAKRKGSNRIRLCCDFRFLNDQLKLHNQPLPLKEELFQELGSYKKKMYFTKFDISNCFTHFELEEKDKPLTAFYARDKIYEYNRLPFGILSAPGIVQELLSQKFIEEKKRDYHANSIVKIFIDDLLTGNPDPRKSMNDIRIIFEVARTCGLKLKFKKCEFFKEKIEYMGVVLRSGEKGMELLVDENNLKAVEKLKKPENEKELRCFLGLCQWVADNTPNLQLILGPLHQITAATKKLPKTKFSDHWKDKQEFCFQEAKKMLAQPKTLVLPDYSRPFFIEVDSSAIGHGGCIYQDHGIVAYYSKALTKNSTAISNDEREVAGVIWIVTKANKFIQASPHPTVIFTDNRVGAYLRTANAPKLRRWRALLDSYNVELRHKKGETMLISDALSRLLKWAEEKDYIPDVSDELVNEFVICKSELKKKEEERTYDELFAYQEHRKYGCCSVQRLMDLHPKLTKTVCQKAVNACMKCIENKKVKTIHQIPGTLKDSKIKNNQWFIDWVFKNQKTPYLSVLDRSTRFFMIKKCTNKTHASAVRALETIMAIAGKPNMITHDREFVANDSVLSDFLRENKIISDAVPRHSPHTILVERYHQELKKIARNSECDYEKAATILNMLPFTNKPSGLKWKQVTPRSLFIENDKTGIKILGDYLERMSENRRLRSEKLRGTNITRFLRSYEIGDIVKYNVNQKESALAEITDKKGSKFYRIQNLRDKSMHVLHANELEKIDLPRDYIDHFYNTN